MASGILIGWSFSQTSPTPLSAPASAPYQTARSETCAPCHSETYNAYQKTAMANSAGEASAGLVPGELSHKPSGVEYRVENRSGQAWMSFGRDSEKLHGERELLAFIGAGEKGRRYLLSDDGFLFVAPVEWSSREKRWDMIPAFAETKQIPLTLPATMECLNCHTGEVSPPIAGTDNKFSDKSFAHGGITCQRCHGSGDSHAAGKGPIVNPAKLPPPDRDAVCLECHFQGTVAVQQPGKTLYQFQPGDRLSVYVHYFLLSGNEPQKAQELTQVEALSLSECKRASADKMWCGTCHDPHREPEPAQKAAYYRAKCVNCHGTDFAAKHHPEKPDCTGCHMPVLPSNQITHTQTTDHRILQNPKAPAVPRLQVRGTIGAPLVAFPPTDAPLANIRDFGLAWETLAQRNFGGASHQAEQYLRKAVTELPEDPVLLSTLGLVEQRNGHDKEARSLYERALKSDPLNNDAAVNLGILEAQSGDLRRAVELWQPAFARVPYRSPIGINLAMAFCVAGQTDDARRFVQRVLEFNPDYEKGKSLLQHLGETPVQCKP